MVGLMGGLSIRFPPKSSVTNCRDIDTRLGIYSCMRGVASGVTTVALLTYFTCKATRGEPGYRSLTTVFMSTRLKIPDSQLQNQGNSRTSDLKIAGHDL